MNYPSNRFNPLLPALTSGLLFWAAWPVSPLNFLIFIAFTPLLWLETKINSRRKYFALVYITMFIWNVSTTWWIWNASPPGAVAAFIANSFLMCLPLLGYKIVKKRLGDVFGYASLVTFWACFEFIHLQDWGLSWPWLTLGNAFATRPGLVLWYEYTGVSGGSVWILLSNVLAFALFMQYQHKGRTRQYFMMLGSWLLLLVGPTLLYNITLNDKGPGSTSRKIVVVQPNIDPYEKVSDAAGSFEFQLGRLLSLSEKLTDSTTSLVIWPETALYTSSRIDEASLTSNPFLDPLWGFLKRFPNTSLFTGIESFKGFDQPTKYSEEYDGKHYESYNGSVVLDSSGARAFYHKSMLVPGVETLPWFLKFIDKWFEKFGGTTAGYAKQEERAVLPAMNGIRIAPSICYESIYGEFMSRYIKNGANLICIITNDGWWKNTPGHKQHMNYARLRAIETKTWVARSANTGISCFIDPYGNVIEPQPWDTAASIIYSVQLPETGFKTFFVRYGDILSRIMVVVSILLIVWVTGLWFKKKFLLK